MELISQKIDAFLGLNNYLHPGSAEYREGMAYRCKNARINEQGLWTRRARLDGCVSAPDTLDCPHGGGNHCKNLAVDSVDKIVKMAVGVSCDVGPNKKLYSTDGSGAVMNVDGNVVSQTRPAAPTLAADASGISRAESGTYYYILTNYNTVYKSEGLPSNVVSHELDKDTANKCVKVTVPAPATDCEIRIWRSLRTSAADEVYSATNRFYYLGKKTGAGDFIDYQHDSDIRDREYEGRGSAPPSDIDYLVSFNNRMLYFKGNVLWWSSAGQPQDVAQEYDLTYASPSETIKCMPKLSLGVQGEAKYEITELAGQEVVGALPAGQRLLVWTQGAIGYLRPTNQLEGYRFTVLYKGIGLINDKCLANTPYGLFGADRQGIWLLNAKGIKRLTEYRVDIHTSTKDTYLTQANITNSFGVWIPLLDEYWWCVGTIQIAYQANRDVFAGPYTYSLTGGCNFVSSGGAQAYLGGSTPSITDEDATSCEFEFWFGQSLLKTIKDNLELEIVHSATPGGNVTAKAYQNCIASTTGATVSPESGTISYGISVGKVAARASGRFFMLQLTTPASGAPIADIGWRFNAIPWLPNSR